VYGGAAALPTPESVPAQPRSPYAVSKFSGELYCQAFAECFPIETVSLRYFNVFGPRQRPDATYAAVVPLFAKALLAGERPTVFGDGHQSRDFTYVGDVVEANLAAAAAPAQVNGRVYNVAPGQNHSVLELLGALAKIVRVEPNPSFSDPRPGDVRDSCADASAARADLGWSAQTSLQEGLESYVEWLRGPRAA
jgi:nucleoside-diphosphate-sugar epimerase